MKKITTYMAATVLSLISVSSFACPKGTTLTGGTGANHKGGKCVAINATTQQAPQTAAKKPTTTVAPSTKPAVKPQAAEPKTSTILPKPTTPKNSAAPAKS